MRWLQGSQRGRSCCFERQSLFPQSSPFIVPPPSSPQGPATLYPSPFRVSLPTLQQPGCLCDPPTPPPCVCGRPPALSHAFLMLDTPAQFSWEVGPKFGFWQLDKQSVGPCVREHGGSWAPSKGEPFEEASGSLDSRSLLYNTQCTEASDPQ